MKVGKWLIGVGWTLLLTAPVSASDFAGSCHVPSERARNLFDDATGLKGAGKLEDAVTVYRIALKEDPQLCRARYLIAEALITQGKWVEAQQELTLYLGSSLDRFERADAEKLKARIAQAVGGSVSSSHKSGSLKDAEAQVRQMIAAGIGDQVRNQKALKWYQAEKRGRAAAAVSGVFLGAGLPLFVSFVAGMSAGEEGGEMEGVENENGVLETETKEPYDLHAAGGFLGVGLLMALSPPFVDAANAPTANRIKGQAFGVSLVITGTVTGILGIIVGNTFSSGSFDDFEVATVTLAATGFTLAFTGVTLALMNLGTDQPPPTLSLSPTRFSLSGHF